MDNRGKLIVGTVVLLILGAIGLSMCGGGEPIAGPPPTAQIDRDSDPFASTSTTATVVTTTTVFGEVPADGHFHETAFHSDMWALQIIDLDDEPSIGEMIAEYDSEYIDDDRELELEAHASGAVMAAITGVDEEGEYGDFLSQLPQVAPRFLVENGVDAVDSTQTNLRIVGASADRGQHLTEEGYGSIDSLEVLVVTKSDQTVEWRIVHVDPDSGALSPSPFG